MIDHGTVSREIERDGFAVLRAVYTRDECERLQQALIEVASEADAALRSREGTVYAIRHLLDLCPSIARMWKKPAAVRLLAEILSGQFGLVRGLLFDKPPNQTWAVPWHQDRTIAIQHPDVVSSCYSPPRLKVGVWHVEPPAGVLESMLTMRIHLDAVTRENGPLEVCPGTHRSGKGFDPSVRTPVCILAEPGDVLLMRPLLAHASSRSKPQATGHRRVIHLEFATNRELPDGYRWHRFDPVIE